MMITSTCVGPEHEPQSSLLEKQLAHWLPERITEIYPIFETTIFRKEDVGQNFSGMEQNILPANALGPTRSPANEAFGAHQLPVRCHTEF